jgi:hypothetical protein
LIAFTYLALPVDATANAIYPACLQKFVRRPSSQLPNTLEGSIFVDAKIEPTVQVATFIYQMFPNFSKCEIEAAVSQYKDPASLFKQVLAVGGK